MELVDESVSRILQNFLAVIAESVNFAKFVC